MKASVSITTAALLLVLQGGNGCALNPNTPMGEIWNGPPPESIASAHPLALRLFFSSQRHDVLVVYDEYPIETTSMRTRAYWLYESEDHLGNDGRVTFVKTNSAIDLVSVPVFNTTVALTTNSPDTLSAVTTNDYSFAIYSGQREVSSHNLPIPSVRKGPGVGEKVLDTAFVIEMEALLSALGAPPE
jgi:hypothetical protein